MIFRVFICLFFKSASYVAWNSIIYVIVCVYVYIFFFFTLPRSASLAYSVTMYWKLLLVGDIEMYLSLVFWIDYLFIYFLFILFKDPPRYQKQQHIAPTIGTYRAGSLPNVNQISAKPGIDLQVGSIFNKDSIVILYIYICTSVFSLCMHTDDL